MQSPEQTRGRVSGGQLFLEACAAPQGVMFPPEESPSYHNSLSWGGEVSTQLRVWGWGWGARKECGAKGVAWTLGSDKPELNPDCVSLGRTLNPLDLRFCLDKMGIQ